jgi:hypothetical protein
VTLALALPIALQLALGAAPAPAARQTVDVLISRVVEAHGGKDAIAAARGFRQAGSVTSMLHPGTRGRIERIYGRSGRLRVLTRYPGAPDELRIVDGGRGWRNGVPVDGVRFAAMALQAVRLDLPALLDAWRDKVVDRGDEVVGGRHLRVLAIEIAPGLSVEAHVDPATGRILRSRGQGPTGGAPLSFLTTYSDFRKVGGVLFAFKEENWANGESTGETVLDRVELLPTASDEPFRP